MQPEEQKPTTDTNDNVTPTTVPETAPTVDAAAEPQTVAPDQPAETLVEQPAAEPDTSPEPSTVITPDVPAESVVSETTAETTETPAVTPPQPETTSSTPTVTDAAAPAAVVAGAAVAGTNPPSGKSKKKLGLLVGIIALVVILLAGAASAYYMVVVPQQTAKITQDVITNTLDAQKFSSGTYEGELGISGGEAGQVLSSIGFEAATKNDSGAFDAKITFNTAVAKVNLDARSTDGKSYYLRLSGLNGLDQLIGAYLGGSVDTETATQYAALLSQVNDQWFVIDQSLLSQVPGANALGSNEAVSSEDAKRIGEMYKKNQFMTVTERLEDQKIHGVDSYHIKATIDKDKLKSFLEELKAANIKGAEIEQGMIDDLPKGDFTKYPFELWIAKKQRVLTQFAMNFEESGSSYKLRIALKDINKPVTVEQPADAKSILELLGGISPMLMGGGSDLSAQRL